MKGISGRYGMASLVLVMATVGLASGCATKKYVRAETDQLTAKMDEKDRALQQGVDANTNQITELSGVTREHTQQISSVQSGLKATDEKAGQAMSVGQGAQGTANQAMTQANNVGRQFQNRNQYTSLAEQSVPFQFGSAEIDEASFSVLDEVARQVKGNADSIVVLEGRTDATGDANYNIQLGERRLEAVLRYLVVGQSVPMQQVHKMSYGEEQPVASNDTREGRAQNRAVVVRVLAPNLSSTGSMMSDAAPAAP
jgi:outer membrane protein OmpA-like peptidoglycan-associated protein